MKRISWEEKVEATLVAPIGSHIVAADTKIVQGDGWYQLITPSAKTTALNEIIFSKIQEQDVPRVIESAMAEYISHGLPFKWCVGPWTKPDNFGSQLTGRGFSDRDAVGMVCEIDKIDIKNSSEVLTEALSERNVDDYVDTFASGWGAEFPQDRKPALRNALLGEIKAGKREFFLAKIGGIPCGTASFYRSSGTAAYLTGGNVLPKYRNRGVYLGLINARFQRLRELSVPLATTHARATTSAPILSRIGFETAFEYKIYEFNPAV